MSWTMLFAISSLLAEAFPSSCRGGESSDPDAVGGRRSGSDQDSVGRLMADAEVERFAEAFVIASPRAMWSARAESAGPLS
jgi:hypothetical protein